MFHVGFLSILFELPNFPLNWDQSEFWFTFLYNFSSFPAFLFDSLVLFCPVFPPQFSVLKKIITSFILLKILVLKSFPGCSILLISSEVNLSQFLFLLAAFLAICFRIFIYRPILKRYYLSPSLCAHPSLSSQSNSLGPSLGFLPIAIQGLSQTSSLNQCEVLLQVFSRRPP